MVGNFYLFLFFKAINSIKLLLVFFLFIRKLLYRDTNFSSVSLQFFPQLYFSTHDAYLCFFVVKRNFSSTENEFLDGRGCFKNFSALLMLLIRLDKNRFLTMLCLHLLSFNFILRTKNSFLYKTRSLDRENSLDKKTNCAKKEQI